MEVFMSKTKRTTSLLLAALLILSVLVLALPISADTTMGGMETNVPDTDIGGATGGGELVTIDPTPESSMPESETATPATDTVTTPVTTSPTTDGATDDTDDGLGWLGIVICVAVVAAIVIVVVALLPKKKEH